LLQYYDKKDDVKRGKQIFTRYRLWLPIFASLSYTMIQRIQSVWLVLAAISSGLVFLFPLASGSGDLMLYIFGWGSKAHVEIDTGALWVLALGCTLLPLPIIFQFRKRSRQLRMILVILLLNLILAMLTLWEISRDEDANYLPGLLLFPAAMMFQILALRAIRKDEKLIRSADRLR
jgi:hypothetical protein